MNTSQAIRYLIGAPLTPDWTITDYDKAADAAYANIKKPLVVSIMKNGSSTIATPFDVYDDASKAYDRLNSDPGNAYYIALYDPSHTDNQARPGMVDFNFFGGEAITEVKKVKEKTPIGGIILAVCTVGFIGMVAVKRSR